MTFHETKETTIVFTRGCVLCSSAFFPRRSHCHQGPLRTLSPLQKGPLPGFKNLPCSASQERQLFPRRPKPDPSARYLSGTHTRTLVRKRAGSDKALLHLLNLVPFWYAKHFQKKPKSHLAPSVRNGDGSLTWDRLKPSIRDWVGPRTEVKVQQLDATRDW